MAIKTLAKSHKKFKKMYGKKYIKLFKELAKKGQSPKTLFISCSDSRVVPNLITYSKPGELFITRNIGNFIPPYDPNMPACATAAVIEYAVVHLKVESIIVCGHTKCGACKALHEGVEDTKNQHNLYRWMSFGQKAKEQAIELVGTKDKKALLRATERFNVITQLQHLMTYPAVKERVEKQKLQIMGWYYHIKSGDLEYFNPVKYNFMPIDDLKEH